MASEKYMPLPQKDEEIIEVYEVAPEMEDAQPKKRSFCRRLIRVCLTVTAVLFLWASFAPMLMGFMSCNHGRRHHGQLPADFIPDLDYIQPAGDVQRPKLEYDFSDRLTGFWVKQGSQSTLPTRTEVRGGIYVTSKDQDHISVKFKVEVSDDSLWEKIVIEPKHDGIFFSADPLAVVKQHVNISAMVTLPSKTHYRGFGIKTRELGIYVGKDFTSHVNASHYETISGHIHTSGTTSSGCTTIQSVSGDVSGEFELKNSLSVSTTSGKQDITINSADLSEKKAYLGTKSVSGDQVVKFVTSLHPRPLHSYHKSVSGNMKVTYPEDWQGRAKLSTTSGILDLIGKNIEIIKKKKGIAGKYWKVAKGFGKSKAKIESVSGSINLKLGK